ncbi:hypothetical protein [Faecalimonas sp.]
MLKEKKYSEYQKRYEEYKKKRKDVERLEENVEQLNREKIEKSASIEREKREKLSEITQRKKDNEDKLASAKKSGVDSTVVKEYSDKKLREIDLLNAEVHSLEKKKADELKKLQDRKKHAIKSLEADKELCQKRLNDVMNGGDGGVFVKTFDEVKFRQQLVKNKESEVSKLTSQYNASIESIQKSIQNIDAQYAAILKRELFYVEGDSQLNDAYSNLSARQITDELPQVLLYALQEPVDSVIERKGLNSGQEVGQVARKASSLDDLSMYMPQWLVKLVEIGFPCIIGGGLLLFFIFSGVRWGFVATATNAIVTFLFGVLCTAIGFGIPYGILTAVKGKIVGIIGGVIGGIIGVLIAIDWGITLPTGITNVVEWLSKVIVCVAVLIGFYFLNKCTGVGSGLMNLGMKIGFVRKAALVKQGYVIQENIDSYYCLLKYSEIIGSIVDGNKARQSSYLNSELSRLQTEKIVEIKQLASKIDADIEKKIVSEKNEAETSRKKYERSQQNLIQIQDECMIELSGYDERISDESASYDENVARTKASYEKRIVKTKEKLEKLKESLTLDKDTLIAQLQSDIRRCQEEYSSEEQNYSEKKIDSEASYDQQISKCLTSIDQKNSELASELDVIHNVFHDIYNNTVGFEESKGVLSDYIYLYNEKSKDEPRRLIPIRHDKKPIVFLYDLQDTTNVSTSLYEFMMSVLTGLYAINANDTFSVIVTDPVSKARKFEPMAQKRLLTIQNEIRDLSKLIQNSMRNVSQKGMHIDDYNRKMSAEEEDKVKYLKYKIVEFIVPEEAAAQNTNFFDSDLWGTLGDGKENGFFPIFFISYSDWRNTFDDDSKLNSKFILQLKNAIGSSNGSVFKIDTENITIEKID